MFPLQHLWATFMGSLVCICFAGTSPKSHLQDILPNPRFKVRSLDWSQETPAAWGLGLGAYWTNLEQDMIFSFGGSRETSRLKLWHNDYMTIEIGDFDRGSYPAVETRPLRAPSERIGSCKVPAPSSYQELLQWTVTWTIVARWPWYL